MNWLSNLWKKWFGEGTPDDYRNPFWRLTEYLAVNVLWAYTILDIRLPYETEQNFWNGFLTFQIYLVAWRWFIWPKLHIVFRPCRAYYLLIGTPGLLFDRGEIHAKFSIHPWQEERDIYGCDEPPGWEEGSI